MAFKVVKNKEEIQIKKGFLWLGKLKVAEQSLPNLSEILMISVDRQMRSMRLNLTLDVKVNGSYVVAKSAHELITSIELYYSDNRRRDRLYIAPHLFLDKAFAETIEKANGKLPNCSYLDDFIKAYEALQSR